MQQRFTQFVSLQIATILLILSLDTPSLNLNKITMYKQHLVKVDSISLYSKKINKRDDLDFRK